jgi:hypothetical protein
MSRQQHDREDLLAEAKALVQRASFEVAGYDGEVVVGFRRDGSASFYFSPERVYQFTSGGELRRAFVDGLIYKAQQRQLASLRREPGQNAVALVRHDLDRSSTQGFLNEMRSHLSALDRALAKGKLRLVAQVPEDADLSGRIRCWLDEFADSEAIAPSPRAT